MSVTRRQTLALLGGGTLVAATAMGVHVTRPLKTALQPWETAGGYDDPRKRAFSWAILAPNPHNRQPWVLDLSRPEEATLFVDTDRLLPHTDPFGRQITIGLGCFLEIARMAALADGYRIETTLFPDGSDPGALDTRPVARCRFVQTTAEVDPLFPYVPERRTLKEEYDMSRPVDPEDMATIAAATRHFPMESTVDKARVAELRQLSAEAFLTEFRTPRTYKESVDLFRIGRREVDANPDGIDFSGPMWETLRLTRQFTREGALDTEGFAYRSGEEMVVGNVMTAMGHLWQVTPGNTREDQIMAGADWVRINLAATALGLGLQPLSQALQEFPEMKPHYDRAHTILAPEGGTVQMWARVGYGPEVPVSPRWPLEAKIAHG